MASYTPNLNLYKPDDSDNYEDFREGFNDNMDKLDQGGGNANQNIAEEYDDTATYVVGDYVIYDGLLYKCDTAVTTAETFDPTKWTHVVVTDEMGSGGGGSGDTVTWTQIQQTGTKIAEIDINGTPQDVYAPQGGGSGGHTIYDKDGTALTQENGLQFAGAVSVSDDSVNGRTVVDVEGGGNYYLNTLYSTEEKKIGYWTDGKPLYQKTINIASTTISSGGSVTFSLQTLGIQNAEKIINADGTAMAGATTIPFNYLSYYSGTLFAITLTIEGDTLMLSRSSSSAITLTDVCITVQYTKTTDTADPNPQFGNVIYLPTIYSEEERQVGVWTDGKPLYQITVDVANPSNDSNEHLVDLSALSIEKCPYLFGYAVRHSGANDLTYYANSIETDGWYYFKARYDNFRDSIMYVCLFKNDSISRMKFTIQYTKTTDTAGSGDWTPSGELAHHYSTNEQVIGTWVDGKPVYECTFYLATASLSSKEFSISTGLSNIKKILTCTGVLTNGSETYMLPFERLTERESIRTFARANSDGTVTLNVITGVGGSSVYSTVTDVYVTITYTKTTD